MTSVLSQSMAQGGTGSASNEAAAAAAHAITAAAATAGLTQHMAFRGHPEGGHAEVGIDHQDQVHGEFILSQSHIVEIRQFCCLDFT